MSFLGSDFVLEKNADLKRIVRAHQGIFRELPGCKSWEDYLALSEGKLFILLIHHLSMVRKCFQSV